MAAPERPAGDVPAPAARQTALAIVSAIRARARERAPLELAAPVLAVPGLAASGPAAQNERGCGTEALVCSYFFPCPHCGATLEVPWGALNCQIFRHGALRASPASPAGTFGDPCQPINPHLPKAECERLVREGAIHGCGGAFRFDGIEARPCDYC
jgi:hypothetical protein